jgi:uncharacterized protein (TIGR00255 family)
MILSMTGFASVTSEHPLGMLSVELRALNHRYLDVQLRLPEELRTLEGVVRERLAARVVRGKVDCRLSLTRATQGDVASKLNVTLLADLATLSRSVRQVIPASAELSVADVLRWPGMMESETVSTELLKDDVLRLLDVALEEFNATRAREGAKLQTVLLDRARSMEALVREAAPRVPQLVAAYGQKLSARLREANLGQDDERLRQEVVLFASRIDVDEEMARLGAHLSELRRIVETGGAVGKRLDFLMQELNREANTLGSKSAELAMTQASVELKVLIEQMREQVQNIE